MLMPDTDFRRQVAKWQDEDARAILNEFAAAQRLASRVGLAAEQDAAEERKVNGLCDTCDVWHLRLSRVVGGGWVCARCLYRAEGARREADEAVWNKAHGIDGCTCDRDPLGVCPHHKSEYAPDCLWDVMLADCLADCEDSNLKPEPTIADFEKAVHAAQLIYRESGYPINPARFFDSNEDALADMKKLAGVDSKEEL